MSALSAYDIILAPVSTEKSGMASESNQVVFKVRRDATKPAIKAAVEQLFKVKVLSVNTILRKGKTKTFRGMRGKQQDVKKAIVKLAEGDKIDVTTRIQHAMALKTVKPTTPSQRQLVLIDRSHVWKGKPIKALTEGLTKSGGRNNQGRVSMWHRGGGHKRSYRMVDFKRGKLGMPATVERLEFDPNRTAFIALIKYEDGELAYILAPQRLQPGDTVIADTRVDVKPGNAMPLANMPIGTIVHNVEMKVGKGGQIARAAGTYVQLVGR